MVAFILFIIVLAAFIASFKKDNKLTVILLWVYVIVNTLFRLFELFY